MKILVLNGSPKKKSDTMNLTKAFLDGLNEAGGNEVEIVNVIDKNIKPCLGCLSCMYSPETRCVQEDDMAELLDLIIGAQLVIWSFPLYCYAMPSQLKAVCDRLLPLNKITMRQQNGRVQHEGKSSSHARHIMICGCGFPAFEGNFSPAVMQFRNCFGKDAPCICVSEAPMLNAAEAEPLTKPFLEKVKAAGRQFAADGSLSEETMLALETPMLPPELYIKIVNG